MTKSLDTLLGVMLSGSSTDATSAEADHIDPVRLLVILQLAPPSDLACT